MPRSPSADENRSLPNVGRLSIAPVKSLGLVHPTEIKLDVTGVAEDRRFFLIDDHGRLIDALVVGPLMRVGAWTDPEAKLLRISLPDGTVIEDEVRVCYPVIVTMYRRTVHGHIVHGPWADELEAFAGRPLRLVVVDRPGELSREYPVTLVSDGSLAELGRHMGTGPVDGRRFRMLIELHGAAPHEEDGWIGRKVGLGDCVIRITGPLARCAKTTLSPDRGIRDADILRAIREYRGLREGRCLDFGVHGEVEIPGVVRLGDQAQLLDD